MTETGLVIGLDPGGSHGFGVAILHGTVVETTTVDCVADAVTWLIAACGTEIPGAAGIDTMLHWSDGPGGWRPADRQLRAAYPAARSSVLSPNGLYGSMGIGGMAIALRLRQRWPGIRLNETHPKLLAYALRGERHTDTDFAAAAHWLSRHAGLDLAQVRTGHAFDAVLSAWATREGALQGWMDLALGDPALLFPAGPAHYWWPPFPRAAA
jgi:hypothetical protein